MMAKVIYSKIAGVSHKNADGESRQQIIRKYCRPGQSLLLIPEPDNEFSDTAVGIWLETKKGRKQLGYIRDTDLDDYIFEHIEDGGRVTCTVSDVTGLQNELSGVNMRIVLEDEQENEHPQITVNPVVNKKPPIKIPLSCLIIVAVGLVLFCIIAILSSI